MILTPLLQQTIVRDPPVPVGLQPRGAAFDGRYIWVPNFGSASVTKIDAITNQVVATISNVGVRPFACAFDGVRIWVSIFAQAEVIAIDPVTNAIIATIDVLPGPRGLVFAQTHLWVANHGEPSAGNTVQQIDPATESIVTTVVVGHSPYGLGFDGTCVWSANFGDDTYTQVEVATGVVVRHVHAVGGVAPVGVAVANGFVWGVNYSSVPETTTINKIDPATGAVVASVVVGSYSEFPCFDGTHLWVPSNFQNALYKIDVTTNLVVDIVPTGMIPFGCVFDGAYVWVSNFGDGTMMKV